MLNWEYEKRDKEKMTYFKYRTQVHAMWLTVKTVLEGQI